MTQRHPHIWSLLVRQDDGERPITTDDVLGFRLADSDHDAGEGDVLAVRARVMATERAVDGRLQVLVSVSWEDIAPTRIIDANPAELPGEVPTLALA